MSARIKVTYGQIADEVEALPVVFREVRALRRMSLRAVASQMDVGFNTLSRFERGAGASLENVVQILRWLDGGAR